MTDRKTVSRTDLARTDLADNEMGRNSLQGDDQANVRNERHAVPDVRLETDGIVESLEKLDKDVRAERDLGKGNRHRKGPAEASAPTEANDND